METPNNSGAGASVNDFAERTGINEGATDTDVLEATSQPEVKEEAKTEEKAEEAKTEEKVETKTEGEEEKTPKSETPTKNESRPLRAVFSQMKDLRQDINKILAKLDSTPAEKKETTQVLDDAVKEIAERRNLDPEGLAEILATAEDRVMKKLEAQGLLKKDLAPELQEKLKILDKVAEDQAREAEQIHDQKEWLAFVPSLQKQYPNAPANLIAEAQKKMDELSHTKDFHDKELDYVLYKNRSVFDAILKVAKANKSGETTSRDMSEEDTGEEKEIDLDPENMTPEKMKADQARQLRMRDKFGDDILKIG